MKIAFDYQIFFLQEHGGISRYYCNLAEYLNNEENTEARIFAPLHINDYLPALPAGIVSGLDTRNRYRSKKIYRTINEVVSGLQIKNYNPDVIHRTYFSEAKWAPKNTPCVVTVYDMIHERFADLYPKGDQTSHLKEIAVKNADHVICISRSTQRDLLEYFDIPKNKTSVVYLGFRGFDPGCDGEDIQPTVNENPYFLYVGQRSVYKNFGNFIQAFASSPELKRNFNVICFGGGEFRKDELQFFKNLGLSEHQITQTGGNDRYLSNCYKNAFAFVYPSLYEGFGIPPLEAMSQDCPVICSNTSSVPEVVGDSAEYFDPVEIESIRQALEHVAMSADRRKELVSKGRKQFRLFQWEKCARETLAIYGNLV